MTGLPFARTKLTVLFALLCVRQQENISSAPLLCLRLVGPAKFVLTQPTIRNSQFIFFPFSGADCDALFIPPRKRLRFAREDRPGGMGNLAAVSWETAVAPVCGQLFASVLPGENVGEQAMIKCCENQGFCKKLKPDTAQPQSLWEILCLWLLQRKAEEPHYNYAVNSGASVI